MSEVDLAANRSPSSATRQPPTTGHPSSPTRNEPRKPTEPIKPRVRTGSLILRSQFAPSAWHAKLGNGAIADAAIDRIAYKSCTIHIEGDESMHKRMGGIN